MSWQVMPLSTSDLPGDRSIRVLTKFTGESGETLSAAQAVTADEDFLQKYLLVFVRQSSVVSIKSDLQMDLRIVHLIGAVERSEGDGLREGYQQRRERPTST
jgi:hypothetical protein